VNGAVYYGKYTRKILEKFPSTGESFDETFVWAYFMVKKACALLNVELGYLDERVGNAIVRACDEWEELKRHVVVDPLCGRADVFLNVNVNEVIASRASEFLGGKREELLVDPFRHVNLHQTANDVFPTAAKVAVISKLRRLVEAVISLQEKIQEKEKEFYGVRKPARLDLMDGPPIMLGQEFGAYAEALTRDRWRLHKVEEKIRGVNIGGTFVGTGLGAPKEYVLRIAERVRDVTGVKISKAENLVDATQNWDVFVEVHGLLKSLAVNLYKISNDLRLLGSGPNTAIGELVLPAVIEDIDPERTNPAVLDYVQQLSHLVLGYDAVISHACALGNLESNHLAPIVVHLTLKSLTLLLNSCKALSSYISLVTVNRQRCEELLQKSGLNLVPLIKVFGHDSVSRALNEVGWDLAKVIKFLSGVHGIPEEEIDEKMKRSE